MLVTQVLTGGTSLGASRIAVEIDGQEVVFPGQQPTVVEGRVLVPVRGVFEKLGYIVGWDKSKQTVLLANEENTVTITVGKLSFTTNGVAYTLAVPAQAVNGRTMLPFRALLESVGCGVVWDAGRKTVLVYSGGLPEGAVSDDDSEGLEEFDKPYVLPPPEGRRVAPGARFGVDIHKNPDVVFHGYFYVGSTSILRYIEVLDSYRRTLPDTARVFCLLAPTNVEFLDERYSAGVAGQKAPTKSIYNRLEGKGVVPVDAYSKLEAHADKEYLYFRTDHHWTAVGAYYAYLAYAETAGFAPVTVDNYLEFAATDFLGSYVRDTPSNAVSNSPDTVYYYKINNGTTFSQSLFRTPTDGGASYSVFLGGDQTIHDFTTSNKNGKVLVVIKESFGNAFIPWVAPHYERIIAIDPRHYTDSITKYLGDCSNADFLFISTANVPSYIGFVEKMERVM